MFNFATTAQCCSESQRAGLRHGGRQQCVSSASLLVCMSCVCVCVWVRGLCEVRSFHTSARSDRHARYLWSTPAAFRLRNKDGSVSTSACFHSLSLVPSSSSAPAPLCRLTCDPSHSIVFGSPLVLCGFRLCYNSHSSGRLLYCIDGNHQWQPSSSSCISFEYSSGGSRLLHLGSAVALGVHLSVLCVIS